MSTLDYWLAQSDDNALDAPLLSDVELRSHDVALRSSADVLLARSSSDVLLASTPAPARVVDLTRIPSSEELLTQLKSRMDSFAPRFASGEWVVAGDSKAALSELSKDPTAEFSEARALHVAVSPVDLYCMPFTMRVRSTTGTPSFDRNRCSQARAQEPIEILGRYGPHLRVARTRYAWGFITNQAALSPPIPAAQVALWRDPVHELSLKADVTLNGRRLPKGTLLPDVTERASAHGGAHEPDALLARESKRFDTWLANAHGFERVQLSTADAQPTTRTLTRRAFLSQAFQYIGAPYGWGDENGGRDCSRLWVDVLNQFGLHPPRTSGEQAVSGLYTVDVPDDASETERFGLLDAAQARGIVLIHFPGHIMAYLGRDHLGTPRVLHSFAEYMTSCKDGAETLLDVGSVEVTDLSLGAGTSRRSFLQRFTRLTVFGKPPDQALLALSTFRRAVPPALPSPEVCRDSADVALFRSPREPHTRTPLRVIAVTQEDTRPASLWLIDPSGKLHEPPTQALGVGPYARFAEVEKPSQGRWTALLADGDRVLACNRIHVSERPPARLAREPEAPAWSAKASWGRATENLYAAFVEQLFSQPEAELGSWPSLTPLLSDRRYNLLFDHLGLQEDQRLTLTPDCADLPYFLRAYFAWKMRLPFGFRSCSRGRAGVAPRCGELLGHSEPIQAEDDVAAFDVFVRTRVGSRVHSASARTLPDDEASDLYPIALTREALKPGTVFADPYGHTLIVAKWIPQGLRGQGMMIAADAQPDATVSRRRFWRGNFLFTPEVHEVGAGFKAFRPVVERKSDKWLEALGSAALASAGPFLAPAMAQYEGTQDDFYTRMDELIYPRPIALEDRLEQLVSALYEQVERRVEAIDVGERGIAPHARPIAMPEGYAVFETSGAWEDFATPSRDMRLLIALDAVSALPGDLKRRPERYGIRTEDAEASERTTAEALSTSLLARTFRYTRSDGSTQQLSLADVLARSRALEVAYNPNDCPEARWGAPEGSEEYAPCKRAAPREQRTRMQRYRAWFEKRARPPR